MFLKSFIMSAVVAFVAAFVAGLAIVTGHFAQQDTMVEFTTLEPGTTASVAPPLDALEVARAYADDQGLTDCVDPAHADLDDVILTVPSGQRTGAVVTPVGFDEALRSGEWDRWNVLACEPAEVGQL